MLVELDLEEAAAPEPMLHWLWFNLLLEWNQAHLLQQAMLEGDEQIPSKELAATEDLGQTSNLSRINSLSALR